MPRKLTAQTKQLQTTVSPDIMAWVESRMAQRRARAAEMEANPAYSVIVDTTPLLPGRILDGYSIGLRLPLLLSLCSLRRRRISRRPYWPLGGGEQTPFNSPGSSALVNQSNHGPGEAPAPEAVNRRQTEHGEPVRPRTLAAAVHIYALIRSIIPIQFLQLCHH